MASQIRPELPPNLNWREKAQRWRVAQGALNLFFGSESPNYVQSSWYDIKNLKLLDEGSGSEGLLTTGADAGASIWADFVPRFKRKVAIISVDHDVLHEVVRKHQVEPAVAVSFGRYMLAGVLPNGFEDLDYREFSNTYEIALREGSRDFGVGIGGWGRQDRLFVLSPDFSISERHIPINKLRPSARFT